jgi:hypothetical protein
MIDLVMKLYSKLGIDFDKKENIFYEKETNEIILVIEETQQGLDNTLINIQGSPNKLKELGWKLSFSVDNILEELL